MFTIFFQEDVNVICVNWSAGAADPNYVRAAVNTRLVGRQVALLIENINNSNDEKINAKTHMIGFSLGAHVAGFAGNQLKNLSRITGKTCQKLHETIYLYNFYDFFQVWTQLGLFLKAMIQPYVWISLMLIMLISFTQTGKV